MPSRKIVINIWATIERKKFDLELGTTLDDRCVYEGKTRGEIHDLIRQTTNDAFDSLK